MQSLTRRSRIWRDEIKELDQEIVRNATDYPKLNALTKEKEETEEKLDGEDGALGVSDRACGTDRTGTGEMTMEKQWITEPGDWAKAGVTKNGQGVNFTLELPEEETAELLLFRKKELQSTGGSDPNGRKSDGRSLFCLSERFPSGTL